MSLAAALNLVSLRAVQMELIGRSGKSSPRLRIQTMVYIASPHVAAGETQIVSSPNGSSWTVRDSSVSGYLYKGICWSGSLFVVVGLGGLIKTSPDGETWTTRAPSGSGNWQLYGVNWCGSLFIATGTHGTILTSPDGINWTDR
jgi:hypothetical protein